VIVGGGAIETGTEYQPRSISEIRMDMPLQRDQQKDIPIYIMSNGDTARARGAAIEALAREGGLT
jgi:hypothetical protein